MDHLSQEGVERRGSGRIKARGRTRQNPVLLLRPRALRDTEFFPDDKTPTFPSFAFRLVMLSDPILFSPKPRSKSSQKSFGGERGRRENSRVLRYALHKWSQTDIPQMLLLRKTCFLSGPLNWGAVLSSSSRAWLYLDLNGKADFTLLEMYTTKIRLISHSIINKYLMKLTDIHTGVSRRNMPKFSVPMFPENLRKQGLIGEKALWARSEYLSRD